MNDITQTISRIFNPELAIMVYSSGKNDLQRQSYYLESHHINEQGQVMEGKPLLQKTLQGIVDVFFDDRNDNSRISGCVPDNILYYKALAAGDYRLVWYRPAEIRMIHFAAQLKITSGRSWMPPLIYVVDKNDMSVFAFKSQTRPKDNCRLYRPPFHNVADDGAVCLGSAKVKKPSEKTFVSVTKYWEDLFWLSEFSHFNGATNPTVSKMDEVWRKLMKSKTKIKWSDIQELKETKRLLNGLLK